jgi:16S rRNA (guanine1207-N2)-methyltransferase
MADHYYTENPVSKEKIIKIDMFFKGISFKFHSSPGVFSKDKIDNGTMLLVESCIPGKNVLDLGCGYGAVGIIVKKINPLSNVTCSDINSRAVSLTEENVKLNNVEINVVQSNIFDSIKKDFDTVLINLPQNAGKDICFKMIEESYNHLIKGGSLQVVSRHQKGGKSYEKKMIEVFKNCEYIGKGSGYRVYLSKKR